MGMLKDSDKTAISERLAEMTDVVNIVLYTSEEGCQYCSETKDLLSEVAELSDLLKLEVKSLDGDEEAQIFIGANRAPAILLLDKNMQDYNIRFFGIPSGYEFATLLEDILMISSGDSGLAQETRDELAKLESDVHMQVFVTPTCPYCAPQVKVAHQMAFESEKVRGDMIEATEFPELSQQYKVMGVPRTIINEDNSIEGMLPEQSFLSELLAAV